MHSYLRQSTAVDVAIGPFLDATDGVTAETALTITQPDIRLKKNAGAWAQKSAAQTLSHEENGWYECSLSTTDTDTLGTLVLAVAETGALPVWHTFQVITANAWDTLFSTDLFQVDVTQIAGAAVSTSTAQLGVNVIQAAGTAWNSGAIGANTLASATITSAKFATDAITATVIADNAIDAGAIASAAITSAKFAAGAIDNNAIADNAIDAGAIASAAITSAKFAAGAIDNNAIAADAIGSSELAASAVTEIQSGLATAAALATIDDFLDTEIAAILAKTDQLTFTVANVLDVNMLRIDGVTTGAANLSVTTQDIGRGTCTSGGTTTSVPTSAFTPSGAATNQFNGRVILFDFDTTTAALRGQQCVITASTNAANPTFTVTTLTTAPASGDTFSVV